MNKKEKLASEYRSFLKDYADPQRAVYEKAYLYSDLKHYGVSVWKRDIFYKQHKKVLEDLSKKEALSLTKFFWSRDFFEERALGLHILNLHCQNLDKSDMTLIEKMMRESKGWVYLDSLIIPIMPILLEKDKSVYKFLNKWIKDDDYWVRRSALLSQLLFFRKNRGDKSLFFKFAENLFNESWIDNIYKDKLQNKRAKFFIRKAIGWSLREMSIKNPNVVFQFIQRNKGKMSGLTLREAKRKLPTSLQKKIT